MSARYRKKPVEIEAIQWTGANLIEVERFAITTTGWKAFMPIAEEDRGDDPSITAEVWDALHSTWVGVKDDQWIIRGVRGEFYPCDPEVFAETYEAVAP